MARPGSLTAAPTRRSPKSSARTRPMVTTRPGSCVPEVRSRPYLIRRDVDVLAHNQPVDGLGQVDLAWLGNLGALAQLGTMEPKGRIIAIDQEQGMTRCHFGIIFDLP